MKGSSDPHFNFIRTGTFCSKFKASMISGLIIGPFDSPPFSMPPAITGEKNKRNIKRYFIGLIIFHPPV